MPKVTTTKNVTRTPDTKAAKPLGKKTAAKVSAKTAAAATPTPSGKLGALIDLMRRPGGATLADLMTATDWQAHSVRGAISGALKRRLGLTIISARTDTARTYRIAG